jgi:hypothetical protein
MIISLSKASLNRILPKKFTDSLNSTIAIQKTQYFTWLQKNYKNKNLNKK